MTYYPLQFLNDNSALLTLISVIVAIIIFLLTWFLDLYKHHKNQQLLLKSLKFKIREIEEMIKSYKETAIPFYPIPLPNESLYVRSLDFKINWKSTSSLKFHINRIQDKCIIINLMMDKIRNSWDDFLKSRKVKIEEIENDKISELFKSYSKENKIFKFYHPRILAILNDCNDKKGLPYSINKVNFLFSDIFNI
ncbi:MAG: hypothetical protein U9Q99_01855 [Nanoarchaeota archaeon]|nr:hypothetical protein [Nanoarchaeota archaeon]